MDAFLDWYNTTAVTALVLLATAGWFPRKQPLVLRLIRARDTWRDDRYRRYWEALEVWEHQHPWHRREP